VSLSAGSRCYSDGAEWKGARTIKRAPKPCIAVISCFLAASCAANCHAILIDDFSIDQAGISTDRVAKVGHLPHPDLLSGERSVWVGGFPGACVCEQSAKVEGGQFVVNRAGGVGWGWRFDMSLNLSGQTGIQVAISELTGTGRTQFSIQSGIHSNNYRNWHSVDVFFDSTGVYTIPFSSFSGFGSQLFLQDVNEIDIETSLDVGGFIAFDSIRTVPEPSTLLVSFATLVLFIYPRLTGRNWRHGMMPGCPSTSVSL
jgi:hypothetical protein